MVRRGHGKLEPGPDYDIHKSGVKVICISVCVVSGQVFAYGLALLGIRLSGHRRPEKEDPQDGEKEEELEDDQPDERTAPGLVFKAIPVKAPNFFKQSGHLFPFYANITIVFRKILLYCPL
jgi:hypothetical protein